MSDPNQSCPSGLANTTHVSTGRLLRVCHNPTIGTCVSTVFPTHGIEYSQITGRIVGYQYGATKAFDTSTKEHTINGVSVTIGEPGYRHHVWTFASAYNEAPTINWSYSCSCISNYVAKLIGYYTPDFVSGEYFCDTGAVKDSFDHTKVNAQHLYTEHPLWDGLGCGAESKCCEFNQPPWFCKHFDEPTADDIEVRLCAYSASPYISEVELFIK